MALAAQSGFDFQIEFHDQFAFFKFSKSDSERD